MGRQRLDEIGEGLGDGEAAAPVEGRGRGGAPASRPGRKDFGHHQRRHGTEAERKGRRVDDERGQRQPPAPRLFAKSLASVTCRLQFNLPCWPTSGLGLLEISRDG